MSSFSELASTGHNSSQNVEAGTPRKLDFWSLALGLRRAFDRGRRRSVLTEDVGAALVAEGPGKICQYETD